MIDNTIFTGGLVRAPEVRYTKSGAGVVSFTIAQSDSKQNDVGEWETVRNMYLPVTVWDGKNRQWTNVLADLQPGQSVAVQGKLFTNNWVNKEGEKRSRLELLAFNVWVEPAGARVSNNTQQQGNWGGNQNQQPQNTGGFGQQDAWNSQPQNTGGFGQSDNEEPPF